MTAGKKGRKSVSIRATVFDQVQDIEDSEWSFLKGMKLVSIKLAKDKKGFKFHRHKKNMYVALNAASPDELEKLLKIATEFKAKVQEMVVKKRGG